MEIYRNARMAVDQMMDVAELFVQANLVKSKTEARKQIKNGGIRIADIKINDPYARIAFHENKFYIVEKGC